VSEEFAAWVGQREEAADVLEPARSRALLAALGAPAALRPGEPLPLLHHWLYFWDVRPPEGLGPDGHPAKGGFLPPVTLPRRMWAGGRLTFFRPLRLGETVQKVSTILKVETKSGRSGTLVFVTVQHELSGDEGLAIREEQDLVYREPPPPGAAPTAPEPAEAPQAPWRRTLEPDPVLLFRYSALTMNGHRIHYDEPYATSEEGYPALVVHGPLQATLLMDLARQNLSAPITGFEFRGLSPAFEGAPLHVCGEAADGGANLWAEQGGRRTFSASVTCGGVA
jgi:3-methylfumaryl-CoA hydratase